VFLDEIAEVDASIQVKLLRVLQTRGFQRVGDTKERRFQGKIVAATNRNLADELQAGRFRADLYYRLCADMIETPALQALLADAPQELPELLRFIAGRVAGDAEADALAAEAEKWITKHLGRDYPWPGNIRELEQCVRNVMIRGEYRPPAAAAEPAASPAEALAAALEAGTLTAEELLRRYCTLVFSRTGSYQETARRLGIDRRTVKEKVDPGVLAQLRPQPSSRSAYSGSRSKS
jgi:DNA-binding NtrC family response regulator